MALTKRSESEAIYLQVKHFSLWREIKAPVEGCETIEVNNPRTAQKVIKYGYRFDNVEGRVVKLEKYDRQYDATRYFGFKMHIVDKSERYVLDLPYQSQILRRLLRVAPSIDWAAPLSISAFKSKKEKPGDLDSTGIWFRQRGETIKPYYTREDPRGMPPATQDKITQEWDFKPQHRWLVNELIEHIIPIIDKVAASVIPPPAEHEGEDVAPETDDWGGAPHAPIDPEDVPFLPYDGRLI